MGSNWTDGHVEAKPTSCNLGKLNKEKRKKNMGEDSEHRGRCRKNNKRIKNFLRGKGKQSLGEPELLFFKTVTLINELILGLLRNKWKNEVLQLTQVKITINFICSLLTGMLIPT